MNLLLQVSARQKIFLQVRHQGRFAGAKSDIAGYGLAKTGLCGDHE
jgi:hypothetical protein